MSQSSASKPPPPNYITPRGFEVLSAEYKQLVEEERPKTVNQVEVAAAHGDRSENAEYKYGKLRLRDVDRRIRFLEKRILHAEVIDPSERSGDRIFFGATVDLEDEEGEVSRYQLVGEDESAPQKGQISWRSPLGRVLLKRQVGDAVTVRRPRGDVEYEILGISYI